jgi:hypothetical protein
MNLRSITETKTAGISLKIEERGDSRSTFMRAGFLSVR